MDDEEREARLRRARLRSAALGHGPAQGGPAQGGPAQGGPAQEGTPGGHPVRSAALDLPGDVIDALAASVVGAMPTLMDHIPAGPALIVGRLGAAPESRRPRAPGHWSGFSPSGAAVWQHSGPAPAVFPPQPRPAPGSGPRPGPRSLTAAAPMAQPGAAWSFNPGPPPGGARGAFGDVGDETASGALSGLGPLLVERLLGALELCLDGLPLDVPDGLPVADRPATMLVAGLVGGPDTLSEAVTSVSRLDQFWPVGTALITSLVPTLAAHPVVAPLLAASIPAPISAPTDADRAEPADEATVAARHGAAHLALAVAVAAVVLRAADPPMVGARPPVIVGTALGAAAIFLRAAPMPPAYGPALLARRRAEYLLPRSAAGTVEVHDHRFALVEGPVFPVPGAAAFAGNGLVEVVPGGALIRTGTARGPVRVTLHVLAEAPPPDPSLAGRAVPGLPERDEFAGWDEGVEVSYAAAAGSASVFGPGSPAADQFVEQTPPWPGEYRLRVLARARDHADDGESYELFVWKALPAPERVLRRTDRLGHRLRGEPEPPPPLEARYRWVRSSALREAATVTVVSGADPDDVLRAFGADPTELVSRMELIESLTTDPWLAVVAVGGAVLAVEDNGYQGADQAVLRNLARLGPVASTFWNVHASTRLSFVRDGVVVAADIGRGFPAAPELAPFLDGLDLADDHSRIAQGLVVVERVTGYRLHAADVDRIHTADVAYRIHPGTRTGL